MQAVHIKTPGLMCEECTNKVKEALGGVTGVVSVMAPHSSGTTSVMFNEALVAKSAIVEVIEAAGFRVEAT